MSGGGTHLMSAFGSGIRVTRRDGMASGRTNKERSVRTLLSAPSVNNVPSCWQHSNSVALSVRWLPPYDVRFYPLSPPPLISLSFFSPVAFDFIRRE
ncbi:hypothetical protein TNIN_47791 [Trichonephila inaurata madagascariensis]|uniref:Uncharacterized protein n=1 Tax=Trichonephila inaurata madagascariensis TaxID=2747483 RepID=A0A8X7CEX7_9ARAC|nr:hypothetical protein TNIN_47791 [Trichonephila inaurata madagascariensis]